MAHYMLRAWNEGSNEDSAENKAQELYEQM